ncbi:class I SAM-dependent methyltransferase [Candidatus Jorgensenbacteria bacterium]|nr:class I SAM-dependent methyltransferase [Candidatus Jorgensenbacteria bacterium]
MRLHYRHPWLYQFLISFLYPKDFLKKICDTVGIRQSIFEVAAGYGRLARHIDKSNKYSGIDLNPIFVSHAVAQGIDVRIGNALDENKYSSTHDVMLVVDVVHHFKDEQNKKLFDIIFPRARNKVVVVEPSFVSITRRWGMFGKLLGWIFSVVDDDGFNKIERWHSDDEYRALFDKRFSSRYSNDFDVSYEKHHGHYLAVFTRKSPLFI